MKFAALLICLLGFTTLIGAQTAPAVQSAAMTVDQALDALRDRGQGLKAIVSDVKLTETDNVFGESKSRIGRFMLQKTDDGNSRIHILYSKRVIDEKETNEKIEYLLEKGWLTDRNYRGKTETRYQVARPDEKIDLFKLGKGPFPLPIGQDKDEVKKHFEPSVVGPTNDDPPGTVHLRLIPIAGTSFARDYSSIDIYIDPKTSMPSRIETNDANMSKLRTTDLSQTIVNPDKPLTDDDFKLAPIDAKDGWTFTEEEMKK